MYLLPYVRVSNLLCQLFKRQETFASLEKEQHDFWFLEVLLCILCVMIILYCEIRKLSLKFRLQISS